MKPEFYDFVELFEKKISVRYIASELDCWNTKTETEDEAIERMRIKRFDLLGVNEDGEIKEFITKNRERRVIDEEEVIFDTTPITKLLELFERGLKRRFFVLRENKVKSIVTRADLQKGPCLLLFFGLIINFEIQCFELIKKHFNSKWEKEISKNRLKKINHRFKQQIRKDDDIDKLYCVDLSDKIKLIRRTEEYSKILENNGISKTRAKKILSKLIDLRNNLAHAKYIRSGFKDWEEIIEVIKVVELITTKVKDHLEKFNQNIIE